MNSKNVPKCSSNVRKNAPKFTRTHTFVFKFPAKSSETLVKSAYILWYDFEKACTIGGSFERFFAKSEVFLYNCG